MIRKAAKKQNKAPRRASTVQPRLKCGNPSRKRPSLEVDASLFDGEAFALCVSQIELAVKQQSPNQAMAVLTRFLQENGVRELLTMDSPISFLQSQNRPIGQEALDVREINMLERAGFLSVRSFLDADPRDLEAIRYFGTATLERMQRIRASVRKEIGGLSPKRNTRREAIERALRRDVN